MVCPATVNMPDNSILPADVLPVNVVMPELCMPVLAFRLFAITLDTKLPLVPLIAVEFNVVELTVVILPIVPVRLVIVDVKKSTETAPAPPDRNDDTFAKLLSIVMKALRILSPVPSLGLVPTLTVITPVVGFQKAIAIILYIAYLADLIKGQRAFKFSS